MLFICIILLSTVAGALIGHNRGRSGLGALMGFFGGLFGLLGMAVALGAALFLPRTQASRAARAARERKGLDL